MDVKLLNLQSKGQIMIPKKWRDEFATTVFKAVKTKNGIVLYPVNIPSDEEFMKDVDKIFKEHDALFRSLADK